MDIYLTIMVTILVITQVVRITQNTIQLHRQNILFKEQLLSALGTNRMDGSWISTTACSRPWSLVHLSTLALRFNREICFVH